MLHVTSGRTWRGGEQQVFHLMKGLADRGVVQHLLAPRGSALVRLTGAAGFPVTAIPLRNEIDPRALIRILGRIRTLRPATLHCHTSQAHGLGAVASRLAGRRRPAVVVTRRVEHSIFRHSSFGLDRLKYEPGADVVLCVSEHVREVLQGDGLDGARLFVVPDGIPVARFAPVDGRRETARAALGIPPGAIVVGSVGHLEPAKGQRDLLRAFAGIARTRGGLDVALRLLIVGDGPDRAALLDLARDEAVEGLVLLPGFRADVPAMLDSMDVYVSPSRTEGLGSGVLEAMASGTPVVASAVGGVPEALAHGEAGRLLPPHDVGGLQREIESTLAELGATTARTHRARDRVTRLFGASRMVDGTLDAYRAARRLREGRSDQSP